MLVNNFLIVTPSSISCLHYILGGSISIESGSTEDKSGESRHGETACFLLVYLVMLWHCYPCGNTYPILHLSSCIIHNASGGRLDLLTASAGLSGNSGDMAIATGDSTARSENGPVSFRPFGQHCCVDGREYCVCFLYCCICVVVSTLDEG